MITLVDTIRAISDLVTTLFSEPPVTKDVDEGFTRPGTYVQTQDIKTEASGGLKLDTYPIRIVRFAEKRKSGYLDLLRYWEMLSDALENPIPVNETFFLYPEDISGEIYRADMALVVEFTVENAQELEEGDDSELMQEIYIAEE